MAAYYNEFDPFAADWLRNLIAAGHIAPGDVDERDIREVTADDVKGYTQCHFFAGIGGWSLALRLAGWDDARPVWTGSCPCQPFSAAGKKAAQSDERHLWPYWYRLIRECRPSTIFGEQVEDAIAAGWLDDAFHDLETEAYSCAPAVLPACAVGAFHRRDRLWFVAHTSHAERGTAAERRRYEHDGENPGREKTSSRFKFYDKSSFLADAAQQRRDGKQNPARQAGRDCIENSGSDMANSTGAIPSDGNLQRSGKQRFYEENRCGSGPTGNAQWQAPGYWAIAKWIDCADGKTRPVKPGLPLLVDGIPGRVGRLRAYGNAIVPQVAAEFIKAYRECVE